MDELRRVLFKGTPYAIEVIGHEQAIASIDLGDAQSFFERHYSTSSPTLIVTGPISHTEVVASAEPIFRDFVATPRSETPAFPDVPLPGERSYSVSGPTAFPERISGIMVANPSPEVRIDLAAATWAMCGKSTSALPALVGRSGIRGVDCGVLEFKEALIVYVHMQSSGRVIQEGGWRRVLSILSQLPNERLSSDAFDGFMSLGHGPNGWARLDPLSRIFLVGHAEMTTGSWERRIRPGNPPSGLPARVHRTASSLLQKPADWPVVDLLPGDAEIVWPSSVSSLEH